MKRLGIVGVLVLGAFTVGSVCWSCWGQDLQTWWSTPSPVEVWYYYANVRDAPLENGYRVVLVEGGYGRWSEELIFQCRITDEFWVAAARANRHGTLELPANRCREIRP